MPVGAQRPGPGQRSLEGFAEVQSERNLEAPNSFARMATPEYWGTDPESFVGIGVAEAMLIDPARFLRRVQGTYRLETPFQASYTGLDRNRHNVALTPEEHELITRSVSSFADAAVGKTLVSRPATTDINIHTAAAERSGVYALQGKQEKIARYLDESLVSDQEALERLMEASQARGLARGKEADMRKDVVWFKDHILEDLLQTLRHVKVDGRSWTQERYDRAKKIIDYRLLFDRTDNRHITFWQDMLSVCYLHNQEKQLLFEDRVHEIGREITKRKPNGDVS